MIPNHIEELAESFVAAFETYNQARNEQRMLLARKLLESGFEVPELGKRQGTARYASRTKNGFKRLNPNFNLKN